MSKLPSRATSASCDRTNMSYSGKALKIRITRRDFSLLLSGLRYVEALRLQAHPDWLDEGFLHIPDFARRRGSGPSVKRGYPCRPRGGLHPLFLQDKATAELERLGPTISDDGRNTPSSTLSG